MKLVKPNDDQLNAAFAEKVAGWTQIDCCLWDVGADRGPTCRERSDGKWISNGGNFAQSADAVLPYLEKKEELGSVIDAIRVGGKWSIIIHAEHSAEDRSFPRACVIALLRAHGVEVET